MINKLQIVNATRISGIKVISNDIRTINSLKYDLTARITDYFTKEVYLTEYYRLKSNSCIWIPRNYPLTYKVDTYNYSYRTIDISHNIHPRDNVQYEAIQFLSKDMNDAILQLPPGYGKTIITIASICNLKIKTLILVDQTDLAKQWCDRVNTFTDVKIKKDDKAELNQDICVVTIQKLLADLKKDPAELWRRIVDAKFGCVVFDEVHVLVGPEKFTNVAYCLPVRKWISVSATPFRLDDTGKMFRYWIGENKYTIANTFKVKVFVVKFDSNISCKTWKYICFGRLNRARYLKILSKSENFYNVITDIIEWCFTKKRRTIILFETVKILENTSKRLKDMNITHGLFYGNNDSSELENQIILATYKKCAKGIDVNLDTLVYATPVAANDITMEQTIGRIQRKFKDKQDPIIIDLHDISSCNHISLDYLLNQRLTYYNKFDFDVFVYDFNDNVRFLTEFDHVYETSFS